MTDESQASDHDKASLRASSASKLDQFMALSAVTSTSGKRKPTIPAQTEAIEQSGAVVAPPSERGSGTITSRELISRAKCTIESSETSRSTSLRAAAEDIALAYEQGATQREVARGVGKSAAWVNRLLKWREGGYVGAP